MIKRQNNRGMAAIVATVLILLITISTIVILWTAVIPFINNILLVDMNSVRLEIVVVEGYTVYDEADQLLSVQVRRGSDEIDLEHIYIVISIDGNSHSYLVDALEAGSKKVYYFGEIKDKPDKISVYASIPLSKKGETAVGNWEVNYVFEGDLDEDEILDSGNWIYLPRDRIKTLNCVGSNGVNAAEGSYCLQGDIQLKGFCDSTGYCIPGDCVIDSNCYRGKECEVPVCSVSGTGGSCSYSEIEDCDELEDAVCGDYLLGDDEECDGYLFGEKDCETEAGAGYIFGDLKCTSDCRIETNDCEFFEEGGNIETVDSFFSGFGTDDDPFMIYNCYQLQSMSHNLTASYELARDIDCSMTKAGADGWWTDGMGFVPIGCGRTGNLASEFLCGTRPWDKSFFGNLEGAGFEIFSLFIDRPNEDDVGLIGSFRGVTLTNLGMVDSVIKGHRIVGGLVGGLDDDATVSNCYNTGDIEGVEYYVGGISGNADAAMISNCYNAGSVNGLSYVGGITGAIKEDGEVSTSYNTGDVTGSYSYFGGITGYVYFGGEVSNCYNIGSVSEGFCAGGIAGRHYGLVSNSYYLGSSSSAGCSSAGEEKSDADMKNETTYYGWDFGSIWNIEEGVRYPWLIGMDF